ncbi:MAG: hypothetical protein QGI83_00530, partial [Candidatus Latescibacteria bacterium]|nr:hypothetical protein [Candidatus Latescibacterota bacterium]
MESEPRPGGDSVEQSDSLVSKRYYSRLLAISVLSVSMVAIIPLVVMTALNYYQYQEAFHDET